MEDIKKCPLKTINSFSVLNIVAFPWTPEVTCPLSHWRSTSGDHKIVTGASSCVPFVNCWTRSKINYLRNCYKASVNPEFGTTLVQRLNQSCVFVVLQSNLIEIKFDKTELGLRDVYNIPNLMWSVNYYIDIHGPWRQLRHSCRGFTKDS